jgi:hypothetical protein
MRNTRMRTMMDDCGHLFACGVCTGYGGKCYVRDRNVRIIDGYCSGQACSTSGQCVKAPCGSDDGW